MHKSEKMSGLDTAIRHQNIDEFILLPARLSGYPAGRNFTSWGLRGPIQESFSPPEQRQLVAAWYEAKRAQINDRPSPPNTFSGAPGSSLIGYGWERAVYTDPDQIDDFVFKVPLTAEVNNYHYQEGTMRGHSICKDYIEPFTAETYFYFGDKNYIRQERLAVESDPYILNPQTAPLEMRRYFNQFGSGLLYMLNDIEWIPDIQLQRTEDIWSINGIGIDVNGVPKLYEFSAYYDEYRISPSLKDEAVVKARTTLEQFIQETAA